MINSKLFQLILGMVLSDATMYRVSHEALVKFERVAPSFYFIYSKSVKNIAL
jgi:hypothetical protein